MSGVFSTCMGGCCIMSVTYSGMESTWVHSKTQLYSSAVLAPCMVNQTHCTGLGSTSSRSLEPNSGTLRGGAMGPGTTIKHFLILCRFLRYCPYLHFQHKEENQVFVPKIMTRHNVNYIHRMPLGDLAYCKHSATSGCCKWWVLKKIASILSNTGSALFLF